MLHHETQAALVVDEAEARRYNPPGQSTLVYRVGTYASFLQRMLDLVPRVSIPDGPNRGARPLLNLNTSANHDWVVALFKAWSMVGDVLTFYQERIANEGFLRTATEYRSVMELVRAINYQLRPGAAANTHLVFTLLQARGAPEQVIVPAGSSVQSAPGPGQLPVVFETSEDIEARVTWNELTPFIPHRSRPPDLGPGTCEVRIKGVRPGLQPGLPLLIVGAARNGASPDATRYLRIIQKVETDRTDGSTRLIWDEPLTGDGPLIDPQVLLLRQRAALFGHDAPSWRDLPASTKERYATRLGGLLRSTDDGSTWHPVNRGLPEKPVQALAIDHRGNTFAGTAEGLFYATDGGQTWEAVAASSTRKDVLCLAVGSDGYLLAGTSSGEILRSVDGGASWDILRGGIMLARGGLSWKPVNARLPKTVIRALVALRARGGKSYLFAGTDRGIVRSTDGGNAWLPANKGLPGRDPSTGLASVVVHALIVEEESGAILAGTDHGVFASWNHGKSWRPRGRGLPNVDDPAPSLFTRIGKAITGLFRHSPSPSPTTPRPRTIVAYSLLAYVDPRDRRHYLLVGTDQGIFISNDRGAHWRSASRGLPADEDSGARTVVRALAVVIDSTTKVTHLFAGTNRGVFRSDDCAATWSLATSGDIHSLAVDRSNSIWAATPPDGFAETEWPGFSIAGNQIDLDKTYARVLKGGWLVLQQSQPTPLTGVFPVREVSTVTRSDFARSSTITRIATDADATLARFDLRETTAFIASDPLTLQDVAIPWLEPIQGNAIRLAGAILDLQPGKSICMSGQRLRARLVAELGGVFRSDSPTWRSAGLIGQTVQSLLFDRTGRLIAGVSDEIYRLTGTAWENVGSPGNRVHALAIEEGGDLLAGTSDGVYRLSGTTWNRIGLAGQTVLTLTVESRGTLCAGTKSGVFRFAASRWEQVGLAGREVLALLVDADCRLVAATGDGVFRAPGTHWENIGPPGHDARCLAQDGQGRLVVGTSDGVFRFDGASWEAIGLTRKAVQALAVDLEENLYAAIEGGGLWSWRAPAATWTPVAIGASNDVRALVIDGQGTVFAGTGNAAIATAEDRPVQLSWTHDALVVVNSYSRIDLDRGFVPTALRTALADRGIAISASATVNVLRPGSKWLLRDDVVLLLEDAPNGLQVYPSQALILLSAPEPIDGQPSLRRWNLLDVSDGEGSIVALVDDFILDRASPDDPCVSEVARIQAAAVTASQEYTTLTLESPLRQSYDPFATTVSANVAPATQGETVSFEVLGSGDSSKANQRFSLKKLPLTYVPAATPGGIKSTLSVYVHPALSRKMIPIPGVARSADLVDAIQWREVPSLYDSRALDRVYMIRLEDESRVSIIFGDGERGARLPSGDENIIATYRTGIGISGNLDANRLTTLKSRPPGIRRVTNPVPATGGEPPESTDTARVRAPLTTRTFGRIVSLQDFEDFVRTFAGVSKAKVVVLENGVNRLVQITLAGENGTSIDEKSELYASLVEAVERYRVPGPPVRIDSFEPVFFNLEAAILVEPDHLADAVLAAATQALARVYAFDSREFGQDLTASDIVTLIQGVVGVRAVRLEAFYRAGGRRELAAGLVAEPARWQGGEIRPAQIVLLNAPDGILLKADNTYE